MSEDEKEYVQPYEDSEDISEIPELSTSRRPQRRRCPPELTKCPKFECELQNNCTMNCKDLEFANAMICEICRHNESCSSKKKVVYLGGEYLQKYKETKAEDIIKGVAKLQKEHEFLEREYRKMTDKLTTIPDWRYSKKNELSKERKIIKFKIELIRQIMDMISIKYKVGLDFEKTE